MRAVHAEAARATDPDQLEGEIMSALVPKSEREWWAQREITKLRDELAEAKSNTHQLCVDQQRQLDERDLFWSHHNIALVELMAEIFQNSTGPAPWHGISDAAKGDLLRAMQNVLLCAAYFRNHSNARRWSSDGRRSNTSD
jgi:hypothetical protein